MPSKTFEWHCKDRQPDKIHKKHLSSKEVKDHPLKFKANIKSNQVSDVYVIQDPLSTTLDGIDPLTQFTQEGSMTDNSPTEESTPDNDWTSRRSAILNKYTTDEKLSMISSYLSGGEKTAKVEATTTLKKRLEQLDDFEEGSEREMGDLTQAEYMKHIEALNRELTQAWHSDQRVKALKITIQCSKLVVDTTAITFYPSKCTLVFDILDVFGRLVFDRLRNKAEYYPPNSPVPTRLPENFTSKMVPESAKETCRNWFFKIASIRELVPRILVEASLLKCYRFLTDGEAPQALSRLCRMVRGIGDPLVAAYARCYLCHVAATMQLSEFFNDNFNEFLRTYPHLLNKCVLGDLIVQKIDMSTYMCLYSPALEWILNIRHYSSPQLHNVFDKVCAMNNNGLLLNSMMKAFPKYFVAEKCSQIIAMIAACGSKDVSQYILWATLGNQLLDDPPEDPLGTLNGVWGHISQIKDPTRYVTCAKVWTKFLLKHFSSIEFNWFLGDIIHHMTPSRMYEHHSAELALIMNLGVSSTLPIMSILGMEHLLPYLELLRDENRLDVCKNLMKAVYETSPEPIHDVIIVNTIMTLCKFLHNSLNALSVDDERRQVSQLLCDFITRAQVYGNQLSFYVDAREAFSNLDPVIIALVHCVNKLSMKPNCKSSKACAAYCFITIPSVESPWTQLQLYYLSAQVALSNNCLGQVDASVKAALSLVLELNKTNNGDQEIRVQYSDSLVLSYLRQMLSSLIIVPDNPEQSILYLTKALIKVIAMYPWSQDTTCKSDALISVLDMLSVARQDVYPYSIKSVDNNSILYGNDPEFLSEIDSMCTEVLELILEHIQENTQHKGVTSFELFVRCLLLTDPSGTSLASNLLKLCRKQQDIDENYLKRTVQYFQPKYPTLQVLQKS
ncbi:hypothetical protein M8J77_026343 [Diaphorina citri]|nr:hypothetical protein M8J77_026343 [Diaphorina citri]